MNELRIADLEVVLSTWNYDEAVERTRPKVTAWSQATMELFRELYIAREALSRRGGARDPNQPTWTDFCADIKLSVFMPSSCLLTGINRQMLSLSPITNFPFPLSVNPQKNYTSFRG